MKRSTWSGSRIQDDVLCRELDGQKLPPDEKRLLERGMAEMVELDRLEKGTRDALLAISRRLGLFRAGALKSNKQPTEGAFAGDNFSTRVTAGTEFATRILSNLPKRPPGRAA